MVCREFRPEYGLFYEKDDFISGHQAESFRAPVCLRVVQQLIHLVNFCLQICRLHLKWRTAFDHGHGAANAPIGVVGLDLAEELARHRHDSANDDVAIVLF